MSSGLMGGAMQAQGQAQFLLNLLEYGTDVQRAMDTTWFRNFSGQNVAIEGAVSDGARAALTPMITW